MRDIPTNAPLHTVRTDFGVFRGLSVPVFPELGRNAIRLFTGVEEELFARIEQPGADTREMADGNVTRLREVQSRVRREQPFASVSPNGTCMIIEGLN